MQNSSLFATLLVGTLLFCSTSTSASDASKPPKFIVQQMQQIILKGNHTSKEDCYTTFAIDGHGNWDMFSRINNNNKIDGDHLASIFTIKDKAGREYIFRQDAGVGPRSFRELRNQGKILGKNAFAFDFTTSKLKCTQGDGKTYIQRHAEEIAKVATVVVMVAMCVATEVTCTVAPITPIPY